MGVLLFIIAVILVGLLFGFSVLTEFVFNLITFRWKSGIKETNLFFERMAVSLDMFGNVACRRFLNLTMSKRKVTLFGEYGQTVSYVLGMLARQEQLTWLGKFVVWLLNLIDTDHCEKAIESQRIQDLKALDRLNG